MACSKLIKRVILGSTWAMVSVINAQASLAAPVSTQTLVGNLNHTTIPFIKNNGQRHPDVAFYTGVPGAAIFIDKHGSLVYAIGNNKEGWSFKETFEGTQKLQPLMRSTAKPSTDKQSANNTVQHVQQYAKPTTTDRLSLGEITNGVRIELQARAQNVEKFFYLSPGADPATINVKLDGIKLSHVNNNGQLVLTTDLGEIVFTKPAAFQNINGKKHTVEVAYAINDNHYGFTVGTYDKTRELVIDPAIAATFLGGSQGYPTYTYDDIYALKVVGNSIYAAGSTQSPDFPTALGYDSSFDFIRDGFVVRMSADLTTLENATFIGGAVYDMKLDSNGDIVVVGQAYSGFPFTGGAYNYPSAYEQTGGFIAKLDPTLTQLISAGVPVPASSIQKLAFGNGGIYFIGRHNVNNLPVTPDALQPACNCTPSGSFGLAPYDGFMGRLSGDMTSLEVLTWIGGDSPVDLVVAEDSSVYVIDAAYTTADGNIRQFDADINSVLASQSFNYLSNEQTTFVQLALGPNYVMVGGTTRKNNLPTTPGAFDSTCGSDGDCDNSGTTYNIYSSDVFLARYSRDLQTIEGLTYFGGDSNDSIQSMVLDTDGSVVFNGTGSANGFPVTSDAEKKNNASGYLARMSNDLTTLIYSTRIDVGGELTLAGDGLGYFSGSVNSSATLPSNGSEFDTTYNGGASDGFIVLYDFGNTSGGGNPGGGDNVAPSADAGSDQTVTQNTTVVLNGTGSSDSDGVVVSYEWIQVSGKKISISNANTSTATFQAPRTRRGKDSTLIFALTVTDNDGASNTDEITITVTP